jgi:hypothetical protein
MAQAVLAQAGRQAVAISGQSTALLRAVAAAVAASTLEVLHPARVRGAKFLSRTPKGE